MLRSRLRPFRIHRTPTPFTRLPSAPAGALFCGTTPRCFNHKHFGIFRLNQFLCRTLSAHIIPTTFQQFGLRYPDDIPFDLNETTDLLVIRKDTQMGARVGRRQLNEANVTVLFDLEVGVEKGVSFEELLLGSEKCRVPEWELGVWIVEKCGEELGLVALKICETGKGKNIIITILFITLKKK